MAKIGGTRKKITGNTEGRKLVVETVFAREARKQELSKQQRDLVVGSLLGDGYLVKTTRGYAFRVNHGPIQKDYVDWKCRILKNLVNSSARFAERCYYFRTISHPFFDHLKEQFYSGRKKVVPYELVESTMSPFMLAVWIMDDGSREGRQMRINSQSFSKNENLLLRHVLHAKLGIKCTLNRDKGKYRLRIGNQSMVQLRKLVLPYIIPSMCYKFLP